jgi:broad specificity phosphatase PhoE
MYTCVVESMSKIYSSHDEDFLSVVVSFALFVGTTVCFSTRQQRRRQQQRTKDVQQQRQHPPRDTNAAATTTSAMTTAEDTRATARRTIDTVMSVDPVTSVVKNYNNEDDHLDEEYNSSMEWYRRRRMEDRMSFREDNSNVQDNLPYRSTQTTTSTVPMKDEEYFNTDNDANQTVFMATNQGLGRRRRSSESAVHCNWNHFEGYNSSDDTEEQYDSQHASIHEPIPLSSAPQRQSNGHIINDIHPMIQSSNMFHELPAACSADSSKEEHVSKLLEGEDLYERELFCGYESRAGKDRLQNQYNDDVPLASFTSPSSTPPPPPPHSLGSSTSLSEYEVAHSATTTTGTIDDKPSIYRQPPQGQFPTSLSSLPRNIRRVQSAPKTTVLNGNHHTNGTGKVPTTTATTTTSTNYIANNRIARAKYNASIMPNQLILIRHGQSLGNVDEKLYATTPDNAMPLTQLGWEQAKAAGQQLKQILTSRYNHNHNVTMVNSTSDINKKDCCGSVHFIVSPYVRTVETFHGIVAAWCDPSEFNHIVHYEQRLNAWYSHLMNEYNITWAEDPRIREQDFGNYQEPQMIQQAKRDRHMFGAFYYRFPLGESASDVRIYFQPIKLVPTIQSTFMKFNDSRNLYMS